MQGIEHSIDDGGWRANRPGLAAALGAQRVVGARRADRAQLKVGQIVGTRHGVVHEAAGQQLARVAVVDAVFQQCLADALGQTAMNLALDDHGVDDGAEVVDGTEAVDAYHARGGSTSTSQI